MAPKPAHDLIESYSDVVPLEDWQDIATSILAAATHGYKPDNDGGGEETGKKALSDEGWFDVPALYGAALLHHITPSQIKNLTLWEVQAMFGEANRIQADATKGRFPSQDEVNAVMADWRDTAQADERI